MYFSRNWIELEFIMVNERSQIEQMSHVVPPIQNQHFISEGIKSEKRVF